MPFQKFKDRMRAHTQTPTAIILKTETESSSEDKRDRKLRSDKI